MCSWSFCLLKLCQQKQSFCFCFAIQPISITVGEHSPVGQRWRHIDRLEARGSRSTCGLRREARCPPVAWGTRPEVHLWPEARSPRSTYGLRREARCPPVAWGTRPQVYLQLQVTDYQNSLVYTVWNTYDTYIVDRNIQCLVLVGPRLSSKQCFLPSLGHRDFGGLN